MSAICLMRRDKKKRNRMISKGMGHLLINTLQTKKSPLNQRAEDYFLGGE
jgi:hypothetical protein